MKRIRLFAIFALVLAQVGSISLASCSSISSPAKEAIEASVESSAQAALTIKDISEYLETKREHYPLSDEFIERYQQTSGGYIAYATQLGVLVDKEQHEPNQKWHFFTSWLEQSLADGSITWDADAKRRVYTGLLCPELLLWIYEACDVSPTKVRAAKEVAEQGKVAGTAVSTIAKNMRACVPWEDLEVNIRNAEKKPTILGIENAIDLSIGNTKSLTPYFKDGSGSFAFESKDETVATVSSSGAITAINNGSTEIVISSIGDDPVSRSVFVEVANHGSESSPLSVEEAMELASSVCLENGDKTNEPIYVGGVASTNMDSTNSFTLNNVKVMGVSIKEGVSSVDQNDEVTIVGRANKNSGYIVFGEDVEVIKNVRGLSTISLKKNDNASVKVGGEDFVSSKKITNGETLSFTVEPKEEQTIEKVSVGQDVLTPKEGVYSFVVHGNAEISVVTSGTPHGDQSIAKYDISYDLGTRKSAKAFASTDEILTSFSKSEGEDLINQVSEYELMYGGANGGSGDTAWCIGNVMKFGTTSVNGSITLNLSQSVNRVKLTGYVYSVTCDVRVGDSSSSDWGDSAADNKTTKVRLSDMTVANKEATDAGSVSSIIIDFESTSSLKIATTNKKPLFLTGIEFVSRGEE